MDYNTTHREIFGTVITFEEGISKEEAENILRKLIENSNGTIVSEVGLRSYNPNIGEPVWYIP